MSRTQWQVVWVAIAAFVSVSAGDLIYHDGGSHVVDSYVSGRLRVDDGFPEAGTEVEVVWPGTLTGGIQGYGSSVVTVSGGVVNGQISAYEDAVIRIGGGQIGAQVVSLGSGEVFISGGQCNGPFLSGLYVGGPYAALIRLAGTNFTVNGVAVEEGDVASAYAGFGKYRTPFAAYPCLTGTIAGTLVDGGLFSQTFFLFGDSDIAFLPEPTTGLLVTGGLFLLRRRRVF